MVASNFEMANKPDEFARTEISDSLKEEAEQEIREKQKIVDYDTKEYPVEVLVQKYKDGLEDDINELQTVIDNDNPVMEKKKMGSKVGDWTKKMLGKAVDGSWKVSLGIAGKLLADAIQAYYGWK
jgi:hypothetical protein